MYKDKNSQIEDLDSQQEFLDKYDSSIYEKASNTVDILLFTVDEEESDDIKKLPEKELKILLIKRKKQPFKDAWAIPGGFIDMNEDLEESAYRELKEETNIDNVYLEQLYTYGNVNRDPRMRVISTSYMALVNKENLNPKAGDDAKEVAWFTVKKEEVSSNNEERVYNLILYNKEYDIQIGYLVVDRIVNNGIIKTTKTHIEPLWCFEDRLAFDHYDIVNMAIDRLRNKIEYTPIIFNLMPNKFTLSNLQKVYETILNKEFTRANFRRKVKKYINELEEKETGKGYKPANLCTYNGFLD